VLKAGREVAAVVAGQGAPETSLRRLVTTGSRVAFAENRLHRAKVLASVKGLGNRQAQSLQIAEIDLGQPDAEVPALCTKSVCCRDCLFKVAWLAFERSCHDADRVRVERTLGRDDGLCRGRMHERSTERRECDERGGVHVVLSAMKSRCPYM